MDNSETSPVFIFDNADPEMQRAYENARSTFRYFWREIAWERKRILPALDLACVKAPFADGDKRQRSKDEPEVEHMWLSDVDFDGEFVSGTLMNSPNWLKSIKEGDRTRVTVAQLSDWMYVIDDQAYGAYTVNLMRSRMSPQERKQHDAAWGLNFGDPSNIRWLSDESHRSMSEGMAASLREHLATNPSLVSDTGHNGWTLLHQEASAGSLATAQVLLEAGADAHAAADNNWTPVQLAEVLGWDSMVELLTRR
jgi:uncharacterized protein YegJ (DUF2314 family)